MDIKPNWQPISMLAELEDIILHAEVDINNFYNTIQPVKHKPYVLDDYTVGRMKEQYEANKHYLKIYKKQLEKWIDEEELTEKQEIKVNDLYNRVKKIYNTVDKILNITKFCEDKTIEKVLDKDEGQLGIETLMGMFEMDDDE